MQFASLFKPFICLLSLISRNIQKAVPQLCTSPRHWTGPNLGLNVSPMNFHKVLVVLDWQDSNFGFYFLPYKIEIIKVKRHPHYIKNYWPIDIYMAISLPHNKHSRDYFFVIIFSDLHVICGRSSCSKNCFNV